MSRAPQATRILVVDDSRAILAILRRAIQAIGYPVLDLRCASNGQEALDMLERFVPDLVITDWHMPGMTGVELFQALRQTGFQSITVGFVTTEHSPRLMQEARRCGAGFILHKPFLDTELAAEITRVLPLQGRDAAAAQAGAAALERDRQAAAARGTARALAATAGRGADAQVLETATAAVDAAKVVLSSASASPVRTAPDDEPASTPATAAPRPAARPAGVSAELLSDRDATEVLRASMGQVPFKLVRQPGLKAKELGLRNLLCVFSAGGRAVAAVAVVDASAVCLIGGSAAALMPSAVRNAMSSGRPSDHMVEQTLHFLERAAPFLAQAMPEGELHIAQHSLVPQDLGKLQKIVETAAQRADFRLTAPGYGDGRVSFVAV